MAQLDPVDLSALLARSATAAQLAAKYGIDEAEVMRQRAHAEATLAALLQPKPSRRAVWLVACVVAAVFAGVAVAQTTCVLNDGLCVFTADQPAVAANVNRNFTTLNDRIRQTAGRVGITNYSSDGGVPTTSTATLAGLTVTGAATVSGTTALNGNTSVTGQLAVSGGLTPNWDSGWVAVPTSTTTDVTLQHNLGVLPRAMQIWWRESPTAAFVMPVMTYDEGNTAQNGPTIAVSSTELRFRRPLGAIAYFHYTGNGTYQGTGVFTGEYRFVLWK